MRTMFARIRRPVTVQRLRVASEPLRRRLSVSASRRRRQALGRAGQTGEHNLKKSRRRMKLLRCARVFWSSSSAIVRSEPARGSGGLADDEFRGKGDFRNKGSAILDAVEQGLCGDSAHLEEGLVDGRKRRGGESSEGG